LSNEGPDGAGASRYNENITGGGGEHFVHAVPSGQADDDGKNAEVLRHVIGGDGVKPACDVM
jgi:hypothetical protein